jgi:PAS domain S-box-containing protein
MFGYSGPEATGRELADLVGSDDQAKVKQAVRLAAREQRREEASGRAVPREGQAFAVQMVLTPCVRGNSRPTCLICVFYDLSGETRQLEEARLMAEQRPRQELAQVLAAYKELEDFTYKMALDQRTPLGHIDNFAARLRRAAGESLDAKCRSYLDTLDAAARQLGRMSDSLLHFARIGQMQMCPLHFNLGDIVRETMRDLRREHAGREIEWVVEDLPSVHGDPAMLGQALSHLLENALKYTRPLPRARIEVAGRTRENEHVISIRDNGIGFDSHQAGQLFAAFQRLPGAREYEGLGLGLAMVRRIIHRHNGRVWAEGVPGQGATFYFALPHLGRDTP